MVEKGSIIVPIKFDGFVVGEAEISKNGEIITAELNASGVGREIRDVLLSGFADSISIRPNYIPAKRCMHINRKIFRSIPSHTKCLDCGERIEQIWKKEN